MIFVLVLLTTFFSVIAAEGDKHLLRYRFPKGGELQWNVQQSLRITTSLKGKTETVETSSRSTKIWTVLDVAEDGTATFEYKVGEVHMKRSQTDKEDESYDSSKDKEIPPAFRSLEETIGVPLANWSIDPFGEMIKKKPLRRYAGASEENRIAIPLPKDPKVVGEKWSIQTPIEVPLPNHTVKKIAAEQQFTLDNVAVGVAKISFRTLIKTPIDNPKIESQIIDKYSSGSVKLDLDSGLLISQEMKVDKRVVGFQGDSSWIHHQSRFTECRCGLPSCDICRR